MWGKTETGYCSGVSPYLKKTQLKIYFVQIFKCENIQSDLNFNYPNSGR